MLLICTDSTRTSHYFKGLARGEGSETFEIPDEWAGNPLYVVWLVYSTGDSFGHDEGNYAEGIGIFNNKEDADEAKRLIEEDNRKGFEYGNNKNHVVLPNGHRIYTGSWKGYFESLDYCNVETCRI